jgi:Flp pilus assembly protein TadD
MLHLKKITFGLGGVLVVGVGIGLLVVFRLNQAPISGYTGSGICRSCHEVFYQKWSTSHHGLAMQPYTPGFARSNLFPQAESIAIGGKAYRAILERGVVRETGPQGTRDYPMVHVMGGKNVYYFLTPLERGKLQVLPLAFDVDKKIWYDNPGSGVRHFAGRQDEALDWTDRLYTFNTACFGCHVSQFATRYDLTKDAYHTTWAEPGINCETCHGPGEEHVRVCKAAPTNSPPKDLKLIVTRTMTPAQRNDLCAPCHARLSPLTGAFTPGDRFFDHFDLVGLENPDFHSDGRDLGENYTMTGWMLSPCAKAGKLDCIHCHTSSGRYRFSGADANKACLSCHEARVKEGSAHTHHASGSKGSECVSCHMPTTRFANMRRSDHSMRPPMPESAIAFGSTLACLNCHHDKTASWALDEVRKWHPDSKVAAPTLYWAGLLESARREDWARLPEMLNYIQRTNREEAVSAALLRLSVACPDEAKWSVLKTVALSDHSPYVRAAAVEACQGNLIPDVVEVLLKAVRDDYRLVRVRAALVLAGVPRESLGAADRAALDKATAELETSLHLRSDDAGAQYNLGNYHAARRDVTNALADYETSIQLRGDFLPPRVNLSSLLNSLGRNEEAERHLREAVRLAPSNAAVRLNFALLLGEVDRLPEARTEYLKVLQLEPTNAVAAYNLAVIAGSSHLVEAIRWSARAAEWRPQEPRYAYTHAYYLMAAGNPVSATAVLQKLLARNPGYTEARQLLRECQKAATSRP